ncbi:UDP-N-acetylglucosamine 1-carboxyvinyltransferase [Exiguobacterium sp. SH31]|uniref:UDP-N-acetylglucosamine 1-carboxyvinyltransferase n=1 Tax=unclassified Exiguobacterium TaxID=2644629 RepID=UPI0008BE5F5B|nr:MULTISPECIES: UDP-N-acetylglucosamine 1-carboxyvinyltransferase [unclassified Exiguobacterium]OGX79517.1 UDP-N-acetylglucosamine 1-carboxyvinyltransferase [Exiguobacterium sp. SH31]TCI71026.1 UDP-N-acetylglucosamine 1-carboxyvinyltransferase [Exiguobacterium sp. SH0S7]
MKDLIVVRGGRKLSGIVRVEGAKNAVLKTLVATLLAGEGKSVLQNVPRLADVYTINKVLRHLGAEVAFDEANNEVTVDASGTIKDEAPLEYVRKMRASILVMGPLLARLGHARVAMPGGCSIGSRPIDLHLKGFEAMGAKTVIGNGFVEASVEGRLQGAKIYLDFPSVGATENIMMAAVLAEGTTVIENVAKEPEIVDLANFLNGMGAHVRGAGTETIRIEGVDKLHGAEHSIIPDRIEAGTFLVAAAITASDIEVIGAEREHLRPLISKMEEMGVKFEETTEGMRVIGPEVLKPIDLKTMPHPGFPTDMQAQMMALVLKAGGTSVITETVFENRFMHVEEFRRMNADIKIEGRSAIIKGGVRLQGAEVVSTDLRAGAALVLAGLIADEETRVGDLYHIDRGYVDFHKKLKALGADIERIEGTVEIAEELVNN